MGCLQNNTVAPCQNDPHSLDLEINIAEIFAHDETETLIIIDPSR